MLRSVQVLKQEAGEQGSEGQVIVQYVKQQALDREQRVAWRDAQKGQAEAEETRRADELQMT